MSNLAEPYVYLSTIPELRTILRHGLLSKVRIFEGWCEKGDRPVQVIKVGGRPLAFARDLRPAVVFQVGAPTRQTIGKLAPPQKGIWLDMDLELYYLPSGARLRFPGQCRHERVSIPAVWLRAQVEQGVRKRMIDAAARREMGTLPRGH